MWKSIIILLVIVLLAGCSFKPKYAFDNTDKALLVTAIGLQVADGVLTDSILDDGGTEYNPLIGEDPSTEKLILFKLAGIGITYWLATELPPTSRKWTLGVLSLFYGGVVWHNAEENK